MDTSLHGRGNTSPLSAEGTELINKGLIKTRYVKIFETQENP